MFLLRAACFAWEAIAGTFCFEGAAVRALREPADAEAIALAGRRLVRIE
jgi:hypothetical protein